jgi:hypothetical protein
MTMKKYKTILFLIILSFLGTKSFAQDDKTLIGKWNGTDAKKETVTFIFTRDKHVSLHLRGKHYGGDDFEANGIKFEMIYELDYTKKPIWIDLILTEKESKVERGRTKGIIKFIDDKNAEILLNFKGNRYGSFGKENDEALLILKKAE